MWGDIVIAFLLAFITAFVLTPYTIRFAKKVGAEDDPKDERRVNKVVMPRLGGIAVILGFIVSCIYLISVMSIEGTIDIFGEENYYIKLLGFLGGIIVLGITCFIDDVKGVRAVVKLAAQIVAAVIVMLCGVKIDMISIPWLDTIGLNGVFSTVLTIGWIVGITNAINLIDGLYLNYNKNSIYIYIYIY